MFDPPERAGSWLGRKVLGLVEVVVVVEVAGDEGGGGRVKLIEMKAGKQDSLPGPCAEGIPAELGL